VKVVSPAVWEQANPFFKWVAPGLITLFNHEDMCLQVVRKTKAEVRKSTANLPLETPLPEGTAGVDYAEEDFDYSTVTVRPCNKYVDYQRWEVSAEWGLPRFQIVRPGIEDGVEYCLTVDTESAHVYMVSACAVLSNATVGDIYSLCRGCWSCVACLLDWRRLNGFDPCHFRLERTAAVFWYYSISFGRQRSQYGQSLFQELNSTSLLLCRLLNVFAILHTVQIH
jgi:hypothetical protein